MTGNLKQRSTLWWADYIWRKHQIPLWNLPCLIDLYFYGVPFYFILWVWISQYFSWILCRFSLALFIWLISVELSWVELSWVSSITIHEIKKQSQSVKWLKSVTIKMIGILRWLVYHYYHYHHYHFVKCLSSELPLLLFKWHYNHLLF